MQERETDNYRRGYAAAEQPAFDAEMMQTTIWVMLFGAIGLWLLMDVFFEGIYNILDRAGFLSSASHFIGM